MNCPKCGSIVADNANFCKNCGAAIPKQPIQPQKPQAQSKVNKLSLVIIILIIVTCLGFVSLAGIVIYKNVSDNVFSDMADSGNKDKKVKSGGVSTPTPTPAPHSPTPSPTPTPEPTDEVLEDEYLFPSDTTLIDEDDLYGKTQEEVAFIRNEIYARHGYVFKTEKYQKYFEQQSWYTPNYSLDEASVGNMLNSIETKNKDFLVKYETEKGWR